MSSISPQVDAAVALMKARAAEFDETKTMKGVGMRAIVTRMVVNAVRVSDWIDVPFFRAGGADAIRRDLLDTMNLCALALGLLPRDGGE